MEILYLVLRIIAYLFIVVTTPILMALFIMVVKDFIKELKLINKEIKSMKDKDGLK